MLSVIDARKNTFGLNDTHINKLIKEIDDKILALAKCGYRTTGIIKGGGVGYNDDLVSHYQEQGFKVSHYTSPYDEIEIRW